MDPGAAGALIGVARVVAAGAETASGLVLSPAGGRLAGYQERPVAIAARTQGFRICTYVADATRFRFCLGGCIQPKEAADLLGAERSTVDARLLRTYVPR